MKSEIKIADLALVSALCFSLAGCNQSSEAPPEINEETKAETPATTAQAPLVSPPTMQAAPKPILQPTDSLAPRYEATLEQGIDFTKPGFPNFLESVEGLSGYEPGHRWSDGKTIRFVFKDNLPERFNLEIIATGFGPNQGKSVGVKVGNVEKAFLLAKDGKIQAYELSFSAVKGTNTIEMVSPQPISPAEYTKGLNSDVRKLGIAFVGLKVLSFKTSND